MDCLYLKILKLKETFDYLKNFGIKNEGEVVLPGTNAKMNEMQALMGSLVLKYFGQIMDKRKQIRDLYRYLLKDVPGLRLSPDFTDDIQYNQAYMTIEIDEREFGISRDRLYEKLKNYNVYTRKYYYPLVCDYACYRNLSVRDPLTVARRVADRVLSLPIYDGLDPNSVEIICRIIIGLQQQQVLRIA